VKFARGFQKSHKGKNNLAGLESIESFVGVPDKGETHFSLLLLRHGTGLSTELSTVVFLGNLINWEVRDVHVGTEFRFEGGANPTKLLPDNTTEERVIFDLRSTTMGSSFLTDTMFWVTEEAKRKPVSRSDDIFLLVGCYCTFG